MPREAKCGQASVVPLEAAVVRLDTLAAGPGPDALAMAVVLGQDALEERLDHH